MHTFHHSESSAKIFGGKPEDYQAIHDFIDATKITFCDFRHRALRHHSFGVFECERVFGVTILNSEGKHVPVRYVAEQHIKEDCGGRIPTVEDWLKHMVPQGWMTRGYKIDVSPEQSEQK